MEGLVSYMEYISLHLRMVWAIGAPPLRSELWHAASNDKSAEPEHKRPTPSGRVPPP